MSNIDNISIGLKNLVLVELHLRVPAVIKSLQTGGKRIYSDPNKHNFITYKTEESLWIGVGVVPALELSSTSLSVYSLTIASHLVTHCLLSVPHINTHTHAPATFHPHYEMELMESVNWQFL